MALALAAVTQQFHQGALQNTNNALDLAIKGDGLSAGSVGSLDQLLHPSRGFPGQ